MTQSPLSERDDLEHHLRSELRDYAPDAPDRLWAGIEARLPQRRRRRPVLWWWLAGAAMAGLFAGMAYRFNGEKSIARDVPAQEAQSAAVTPIAWTTAKNTAGGSAAAPVATQAVLPALEGTTQPADAWEAIPSAIGVFNPASSVKPSDACALAV